MTEKRFYYNTFYHADDLSRVLEYEIIDRQSYPNYPYHDEKEDIPNWYIYIDENDSGWQDMLVELLNALHEENEQLKQQLKTKHIVNKQYEELMILKEENKELKAFKQQIFNLIDKTLDEVYDIECDCSICVAEQVLNELKKELQE